MLFISIYMPLLDEIVVPNFDLLNDQAIENLMFPIEVSYFSYFGGKKKHWKKQVPWKTSEDITKLSVDIQ